MEAKVKRLKVCVMRQDGVTEVEMKPILIGIYHSIFELDPSCLWPEILDRGVWREKDRWLPTWSLAPHKSVDWYIHVARQKSKLRGTLNATALTNELFAAHGRNDSPWIDVVIVRERMHWCDASTRMVSGIGPRHAALISIFSARLLSSRDFARTVMSDIMHEMGHVLGLFLGPFRGDMTDAEITALHCQNTCVMQSGAECRSLEELQKKPYCDDCLSQSWKR